MKKIILSALSMMVALTMSAITYQDQVSITLDDGTYMNTIVVGEASELPAGINNGYASEIQNLDEMPLAIYALYNGVKYNPFAMKSYENQPLGIKTTGETTYWLYFDDVTGTVNLYDKKLGAAVPVTEGGAYEFTISNEEKNSLLNDRFVINRQVYNVTLNGHYLATFSAPENVIIPTGLNAYTAEFQGEQSLLLVHKITGNYIPKNTGVILFNPLGGKTSTQYDFSLEIYDGNVDAIEGTNNLKPSSAWVYPFEGTVYVLHDSEMWLYDGANMKPNKAFLHVQVGSGAPQRIRMVFSEEQGIESIAAEGKAVKFVENGRVFIKRGDKVYNLQGQLVK